ncbi:26907_t:CDS:2 [Dentiscutata erythropus]|uniref:26907_t:CDS:1 n=1 Tax=Dentiscutata erythropus TaxID=1348616 RepID=A0A9N9FAY8_9GLOM|nr:26907_t:CDS:2 [Dentiscutata erythropus]
MFINICQYLPPKDLLSLAQVCKLFNRYLCSENSTTTQEIWRTSRIEFLPFLQMPPPECMNERQYVKLVLERGCQFCKKPKIRKVYFEFLVRCCEDCLKSRTIRQDQIEDIMPEFPNFYEIISGLPFIPSWSRRDWDSDTEKNPSSLYWKADVIETIAEYKSIPDDPPTLREDWLKQRQKEGDEKMKDIIERKKECNKGLREKNMKNSQKKFERSNLIKTKILSMKDEKNENNCLKFNKEILEDCQTYKNYMFMFRRSALPFTERAWLLLKNKLLKEYEESYERKRQCRREREKLWSRETVFQMRQYDIYLIAKTWLPESVKSIESSELFSPSDIGIFDTSLSSASSFIVEEQNSISNVINENSGIVDTIPNLITENLSNMDILPIYTTITAFTHSTSSFPDCIYTNSYDPLLTSTTSFTISSNPSINDITDPSFSTNSLNSTSSSTLNSSFNLENSINFDQHSLLCKYLPWCPSFQNPPFHNNDPYNLWDDEFLQKSLMPRIWNEALNLKKTFSPFIINGSITSKNLSVQKAVLCNMKSNNIFQCKLCKQQQLSNFNSCYSPLYTKAFLSYSKPVSYFQVRQHLFNDHKIFHIFDDEMIDVVFNGLIDPGSSISNTFVFSNCVKSLSSAGYNFWLLDGIV